MVKTKRAVQDQRVLGGKQATHNTTGQKRKTKQNTLAGIRVKQRIFIAENKKNKESITITSGHADCRA